MQAKPVNPRRALLLLLGYFKPHWKLATTGIFLLALCSGATVLAPYFMGKLVDALKLGDTQNSYLYMGCIAALELLKVFSLTSASYCLSITGQRTLHALRQAVMEKLYTLPIATIRERTPGQLISHITSDIGSLVDLFSATFLEAVERIMVVVGIVITVLSLHLYLGAALLTSFSILFLAGALMTVLVHRFYTQLREANGQLQRVLGETIPAIPTIRYFNLHSLRDEALESASQNLKIAQFRPACGYAVFHPLITLVNAISMALLIWLGGSMVNRGEITFGTLISMSSYILWLFWPIMHIVDRWNVLLSGSAAAQRIFTLLAEPSESTGGTLLLPEKLGGQIDLDRLSFAYNPAAPVFEKLSLSIQPGQHVALVGASGSGKTTIANLLLRLWDLQQGKISFDGIDSAKVSRPDLRRRIGLIEQDLFLFNGSIKDNITLWDEENSERINQLTAQLPNLPDLNLNLDERGSNLSMGEKQLIALARALYSQPEILILDEATAHLDPILDRQLQSATSAVAGGVTTITIAHRLASVVACDQIFVLHHGKLVESGRHADLLSKGGIYSKLYILETEQQGLL